MHKTPNMEKQELEKEILRFLDELCIDWGFCIPRKDAESMSKKRSYSADQFAYDLLLAEGFIPENEVEWRRRIRRRFTEKFGCEALTSE